jgi:hypothetical protein
MGGARAAVVDRGQAARQDHVVIDPFVNKGFSRRGRRPPDPLNQAPENT